VEGGLNTHEQHHPCLQVDVGDCIGFNSGNILLMIRRMFLDEGWKALLLGSRGQNFGRHDESRGAR
jgi:hypothetical protein